MLKKSATEGKVKLEAKVEKGRKVRSLLNLNLNLSLPQTPQPC
jgi:hypothetical protein